MDNNLVTRREFDLCIKNVELSLKHIEVTVDASAADLKEFKEDLNPAFNRVQQQLINHLKQETQNRREKWSPWQMVVTAIVAAAAVGMFIVSLVK